ncbi:MAG: 23S rRNA (adenine(2503)-C(2))-methyltransferase RlmN [Clostridia bacterium]|nr:23S rRNA (adenine(2503)-C(2))-methyltransferase RlmN [Clostridia bacterium]
MIDIKSMSIDELSVTVKQLGEPVFRAKQLFKWLQSGADSFDEMTNIPKSFAAALSEMSYIAFAKIERRFVSEIDGTVKYLFRLYDGEFVESVLMKYEHGYTLCVSTQVGCNMGCKFCASGLFGKTRDLTASEILSQITAAQHDSNIRISNVVMMGMGEPLDNFENCARFLRLVSDKSGLNIGLRHISLSTCGLVSGIDRLAELNLPITLSVSLHAPFDSIRDTIMPVNKKWNISALLAACRRYQSVTTRRISFEYALISGVNDTFECAKELSKITKGIMCHINLIPANPVKEKSFSKPDYEKVIKFKNYLTTLGLNATVRRTLGSDIDASCGQLRKRFKEGLNSAIVQ